MFFILYLWSNKNNYHVTNSKIFITIDNIICNFSINAHIIIKANYCKYIKLKHRRMIIILTHSL